ncbi:2,5-dichloro-2,5-cyclohexadiene-1,4-diol dehydrogenase LinX-like isoform X1 [Littorina saxatilis]|uniref:2,5-dichloro-2,5-cyclohexadiene-1,4-diol dehydrogenase LinX-like isoform X1 n=1 Tax=Littorina saxatilis TaxID=31220 RepID=UPI0038B51977
MDDFKGKVILITGSSAGLGAGTAVHFADRGARLSLTGRDEAKLKGVVSKCVQAGLKESDVLTTVGDLTDETFRNQLVTRTVDTFGQLDVLVNNAGSLVPGQLSDPGMDSYHTQFDLNLTAQVALTKLAVPHLLKVKGNIVNVSSHVSFVPRTGCGAYCMTKAALDMFTKVLALVPESVTQKSSGGSAWTTNRLKCSSRVLRRPILFRERANRKTSLAQSHSWLRTKAPSSQESCWWWMEGEDTLRGKSNFNYLLLRHSPSRGSPSQI